jgi:hypothetical protein
MERQIDKELDGHKQMAEALYAKTTRTGLSLSVPTGIHALAGAFDPSTLLTMSLGAIGLILIAGWYEYREGKRQLTESPWHYLLDLNREFSKTNDYHDIKNGMKQLIYG